MAILDELAVVCEKALALESEGLTLARNLGEGHTQQVNGRLKVDLAHILAGKLHMLQPALPHVREDAAEETAQRLQAVK